MFRKTHFLREKLKLNKFYTKIIKNKKKIIFILRKHTYKMNINIFKCLISHINFDYI